MSSRFIAKVVAIPDAYRVVINAGQEQGVKQGHSFTIVALGETIVDPESKEELGQLEIVRGKTRVEHIQEKMTTLVSSEDEPAEVQEVRRSPTTLASIFGETVITKPGIRKLKSLAGVEIGDLVVLSS
jgi:hypothetical protein